MYVGIWVAVCCSVCCCVLQCVLQYEMRKHPFECLWHEKLMLQLFKKCLF